MNTKERIRRVLSENYLTAFGLASDEVKDYLEGKRSDCVLSGFEWSVFKRNILDNLDDVIYSSFATTTQRYDLYYLCGSALYATESGALDRILSTIFQKLLDGGNSRDISTTKQTRKKPDINIELKDLAKKLKEYTAICANRILKRSPKGIIVSANDLRVKLENVDFATKCLKDVIDGYATHRTCLLAINDVICERLKDDNYNLSFCSFLQRLLQCVTNSRSNRVAFLKAAINKKKQTTTSTDKIELKICGECSVPVNVYDKPKFDKNYVSTDDILDSVKYNCLHMCPFQYTMKTYEEEEDGRRRRDLTGGKRPIYRVYNVNCYKKRICTCPCADPECLDLLTLNENEKIRVSARRSKSHSK